MFTSNRFNVVPTKDCRNRLEDALSNDRPIARGEKNKAAVIAIQSALSDLNHMYLLPSEIDGFYGSRTFEAVEAFQRDYGLVADGIVARQTLTQLDSLFSSDSLRKPRGISVHVGVDKLSNDHYGAAAANLELSSCVNDARKMKEIAETLGYDAVIYENENATVKNFTGFMRSAITDLCDGDSLLFTFSGHGSQLVNTSTDAEDDNLDETLLFYDRMLIDDEIYLLLSQFRKGVRVHIVFDSCHSGSAAKDFNTAQTEQEEYEKKIKKQLEGKQPDIPGINLHIPDPDKEKIKPLNEEDLQPIKGGEITSALDGNAPKFQTPPKSKNKEEKNKEIIALFKELHDEEIPTVKNKKQANFWDIINDKNKEVYDAVKNVVGDNEDTQLLCSVITLSACLDSQTTPAGMVYSFFTYNIVNLWNSGEFQDSYSKFHKSLVNIGRPDSTPVISTYGTNIANARLYERPFVF